MAAIHEHNTAYVIGRPYVDLCTRMSFRRFDVEGLENIPTDGAVIFTPNHTNTLMDALVILRLRREATVFGARADIFKKPAVAKILRWLKILPLSRARDGRDALQNNHAVFDEAIRSIGDGVPFCMFIEGTHRTKHSLLPLKKGIFHLCTSAREQLGDMPIYIVPIGIDYSDWFHFMGDVKVKIGKALDFKDYEGNWESLRDDLHGRMASLITWFPDDENYEAAVKQWEAQKKAEIRKHTGVLSWVLALLLLPVLVACAGICAPFLIIEAILCCKAKDKAWCNTIRYGVILFFALWWPFHSLFYLIMNYYRKIL